jgi:hypothetical protein
MVTHFRAAPVLLLAAALAGCAGQPGAGASRAPLLSWAAYLQGGDLRLACLSQIAGSEGTRKGAAKAMKNPAKDVATARFRLVHSGSRTGQITIIDLAGLPDGTGLAEARRIDAASLAGLGPQEALAAWDGHIDRLRLTALEFAVLSVRLESEDALAVGGTEPGGPAEGPPRLAWYMTSCHGGDFAFSAYLGAGDPWRGAAFAP